jgi:hypothetical protein
LELAPWRTLALVAETLLSVAIAYRQSVETITPQSVIVQDIYIQLETATYSSDAELEFPTYQEIVNLLLVSPPPTTGSQVIAIKPSNLVLVLLTVPVLVVPQVKRY